jgi:phage gp36-like protein
VSYFSDADLTERLRGTGITPASAEIVAARAFAEGYVDAALNGRYRVPFDPVPDAVRFVALDIAAYEVLSKHFTSEDPNVGDLVRQFWSRAQDTLGGLAAGRLRLGGDAVVDEPAEKQPLASRKADDSVFRLPDGGSAESGTMEDW